MYCENLIGSYKCLCPVGFPLINGTCKGINKKSIKFLLYYFKGISSVSILKNLSYNFDNIIALNNNICPKGYYMNNANNTCEDINECAFDAPCQYQCINTHGGFYCICPIGYTLNELGQCNGKQKTF